MKLQSRFVLVVLGITGLISMAPEILAQCAIDDSTTNVAQGYRLR